MNARTDANVPATRYAAVAMLACVLAVPLVRAAQPQRVESIAGYQGRELTLSDLEHRSPRVATGLREGLVAVDELVAEVDELLFIELLAREARALQLHRSGVIEARIAELLAEAYLRSRIPRERLEVTESEVEAHYEANLERFRKPRRLRVRHLLFATRAQAERAHAQLRNGRATFESLLSSSLDPAASIAAGDLGWLDEDELPSGLASAVLALELGAVSGPIRSEFGYHLVRLIGRGPIAHRPLSEVFADIARELRAARRQSLVLQVKNELYSRYRARIDADALRDIAPAQPVLNRGGRDHAPPKRARLALLSERVDLGALHEPVSSFAVMVANHGDLPFKLTRIRSTCDCIESALTPTTLAPGARGRLTLVIERDALASSGRDTHQLAIESDDPRARVKILSVRARAPAAPSSISGG